MYEGGTYAPARGPRAAAAGAAARARRARPAALRLRPRAGRARARGRRRRRQAGRARCAPPASTRTGSTPRRRPARRRASSGSRSPTSASTRPSCRRRSRGRGRGLARARAPRRAGRGAARIRGWLRPAGGSSSRSRTSPRLQARIGGDRWFHQDVPRHRTHLTPAGASALLERSGFRVERVRHLLVEQNPLGMWQTLLNRLTGERDFAFRLLKRDLGPGAAAPRRDLAVTAGRRAAAGRRSRWPPSSPPGSPGAAARSWSRRGRADERGPASTRGRARRSARERLGPPARVARRAPRPPDDRRSTTAPAAARRGGLRPRTRASRCCGSPRPTSATPRAINLGAERGRRGAIVLLNDDCVCDPGFVERIAAPARPGRRGGDGRRGDARLARPRR